MPPGKEIRDATECEDAVQRIRESDGTYNATYTTWNTWNHDDLPNCFRGGPIDPMNVEYNSGNPLSNDSTAFPICHKDYHAYNPSGLLYNTGGEMCEPGKEIGNTTDCENANESLRGSDPSYIGTFDETSIVESSDLPRCYKYKDVVQFNRHSNPTNNNSPTISALCHKNYQVPAEDCEYTPWIAAPGSVCQIPTSEIDTLCDDMTVPLGKIRKVRQVNVPAMYGGTCNEPTSQMDDCAYQCPIECDGEWSPYTPCVDSSGQLQLCEESGTKRKRIRFKSRNVRGY